MAPAKLQNSLQSIPSKKEGSSVTAYNARYIIVAILLATAIALCARVITHQMIVTGWFS